MHSSKFLLYLGPTATLAARYRVGGTNSTNCIGDEIQWQAWTDVGKCSNLTSDGTSVGFAAAVADVEGKTFLCEWYTEPSCGYKIAYGSVDAFRKENLEGEFTCVASDTWVRRYSILCRERPL